MRLVVVVIRGLMFVLTEVDIEVYCNEVIDASSLWSFAYV